ncbi:MAG: LEA type 2 family protein [Rhodospirillales bacterium]|nr:LEA type 2 family protein [Rhodospirillales bacterium]
MNRVIPWLSVGLFFLLAACAPIEKTLPPKVRLANLQFLDSTVFEQRMRVDLRVGNPNNFDLPLEGLTFELEVNDNLLAEGYSNEAVTIPRLGEATVPVLATSSLFDLVQQFMTLGQSDHLSYRLSGRAYMTGLVSRGVPFETSGKLELQQGPGQSFAPL